MNHYISGVYFIMTADQTRKDEVMRSLVLRYGSPVSDRMTLCVKSPNEHGYSFRKIVSLSFDQARDLVASQTNVIFDGVMPSGTRHVDPGVLYISKRSVSCENEAQFALSLRRNSGMESICHLHEDDLDAILSTDVEVILDPDIFHEPDETIEMSV